jgi:hypothetical protein
LCDSSILASHNPTSDQFESLYSVVEDSDVQKVIEGCHENYLSVHFTDPMMGKVNTFFIWNISLTFIKTLDCLHWLEYADLIETSIYQEQSHGLHKFLNAVPMAFHKMCGTSSLTPNINYPRSETHVRNSTYHHPSNSRYSLEPHVAIVGTSYIPF